MVRARGTVVVKTTIADGKAPRRVEHSDADRAALTSIVVNEVTVIGSRCGPFDTAVAALESGSVHVLPLISERFDLSHGLDAMDRAAAPGVMKVLIDVAPST
jgi:threonine dehydrogenase-like Zn-dependent dehydrogenase